MGVRLKVLAGSCGDSIGVLLGFCKEPIGILLGFCEGSVRILLSAARILLGFCGDSASLSSASDQHSAGIMFAILKGFSGNLLGIL